MKNLALIILAISLGACSSSLKKQQELIAKTPEQIAHEKWLDQDITPKYPPHILKRSPIYAKTQGDRVELRKRLGLPEKHNEAEIGYFGVHGFNEYWPKGNGDVCSHIIYEHGQCDAGLYCVKSSYDKTPFHGKCRRFQDIPIERNELADILKTN